MTRKRLQLVLAMLAVCASLAFAALAGARATVSDFLFGPKVVSAEVVVLDGGVLHDYTIRRGRIRAIAGRTLTLKQRDGIVSQVDVAPDARVDVAGRLVPFERLRVGLYVETMQDKDQPAQVVRILAR